MSSHSGIGGELEEFANVYIASTLPVLDIEKEATAAS